MLALLTALLLAAATARPVTAWSAQADAPALYRKHCAVCHGPERLGAMGPALLPENLGRFKPGEAASVIASGRAATQMPAFGERLQAADIQALVALIYTKPIAVPTWGLREIRATRQTLVPAGELPHAPVHAADPSKLFVVVELGDHHATILDGTTFTPIHRFKTHFALHGGPKYSPSGRFVYFASRDGWISKFDLWGLRGVAEVRAGINTRNLAVSDDGRYVLVGNYLPHSLVLLAAEDLREP